MTRYQYKTFAVTDSIELEEDLNRYGADGWRLDFLDQIGAGVASAWPIKTVAVLVRSIDE